MSSEYVRVIPVSQKHRRQTPLNPINVEYFNCKSFQAKTKYGNDRSRTPLKQYFASVQEFMRPNL